MDCSRCSTALGPCYLSFLDSPRMQPAPARILGTPSAIGSRGLGMRILPHCALHSADIVEGVHRQAPSLRHFRIALPGVHRPSDHFDLEATMAKDPSHQLHWHLIRCLHMLKHDPAQSGRRFSHASGGILRCPRSGPAVRRRVHSGRESHRAEHDSWRTRHRGTLRPGPAWPKVASFDSSLSGDDWLRASWTFGRRCPTADVPRVILEHVAPAPAPLASVFSTPETPPPIA